MDLNGIILLSQILSFDNSVDGPKLNPGVDQAYALALPTYAATAYYHKKLPTQPAALEPFLAEVEQFALGDYMSALLQGSELPDGAQAGGRGEAARVHGAAGGAAAEGESARHRRACSRRTCNWTRTRRPGGWTTRYKGPDLDPLSEEAEYDPQSNAISAAYTAAINSYLRKDLKYGDQQTYMPGAYGMPGSRGTSGTRRRAGRRWTSGSERRRT